MKHFTLLLVSCVCGLTAHAQMTVTGRFELGSPNYAALSIPQEFSYDNSPKLTMYDNSSQQESMLIYDEDLNLVKTVDLGRDMTFDYQLTYQDLKREVKEVSEKGKQQTRTYSSFQYFVEQNMIMDPTFTQKLIITIQENGDSLITYDYSNNQYGVTNEKMYFAYNYFGRKYPKIYWICSQGKMYEYRTRYAITYTDWHSAGTHTSTEHKKMERIKLCNINLNRGDGRANYYFVVSQTLFNHDAAYEYVVPKFKLSSKETAPSDEVSIIYNPDEDETVVTTGSAVISEESKLALAGFKVVSADGTVVNDLDFDGDFKGNIDIYYAYVITIGKNTYLAFNGTVGGKRSTVFYKIDRTTSSIRQVKKAALSMMLSPVVAGRNATIDIKLKDENNAGSEIAVVSASGTQVEHISMPANQTSSQFNINASSGIYCVSRIQKGKVIETKKIVIK